MARTKQDIQLHISALEKRLAKRTKELLEQQKEGVKWQLQQGNKDDIYRLKREINELKRDLKTIR